MCVYNHATPLSTLTLSTLTLSTLALSTLALSTLALSTLALSTLALHPYGKSSYKAPIQPPLQRSSGWSALYFLQ